MQETLRNLNEVPFGTSCPYLGLQDDPATHALFPVGEHRCLAIGSKPIALDRQVQFCLTEQYGACPSLSLRPVGVETADTPSSSNRGTLISFALGMAAVCAGFGALLIMGLASSLIAASIVVIGVVSLALSFAEPAQRLLAGELEMVDEEAPPTPYRT